MLSDTRGMRGRRLCWLGAVLSLMMSLAGCGETGGEAAWGPPIELAANPNGFFETTVATDSRGNQYVAWSDHGSEVWVTLLSRNDAPRTERLGAGPTFKLAVHDRGKAALIVGGSPSSGGLTVYHRTGAQDSWDVGSIPTLGEVVAATFDTAARLVILGRGRTAPNAIVAVAENDRGDFGEPRVVGQVSDSFGSAQIVSLPATDLAVLWIEYFSPHPRVSAPRPPYAVQRQAGRWSSPGQLDGTALGQLVAGGRGDAYISGTEIWRFTFPGVWRKHTAAQVQADNILAATDPDGIVQVWAVPDTDQVLWRTIGERGVGRQGELKSPVTVSNTNLSLATSGQSTLLAWTSAVLSNGLWASGGFETPVALSSGGQTACVGGGSSGVSQIRAAVAPSGQGAIIWTVHGCDPSRLMVRTRR